MGKVLALYDVRGIQNYIYRTTKEKDAIGASAIIETIFEDALNHTATKLNIEQDVILEWSNEEGPLDYTGCEKKIQVLYIGGGNALLMCESRDLCLKINQFMSKYIIKNTYSLQLAAAMVEVTGDYEEDNLKLRKEMDHVKENMVLSKPLGTLPIMEAEVKTGYPAVTESEQDGTKIGSETSLKQNKEREIRKSIETEEKKFDNYTTKKGADSTIAVVHIDGNNMGDRIRKLMDGIKDYQTAINQMRNISWQINHSYKFTFDKMKNFFNNNAGKLAEYAEKGNENFVLKILTAGDDITYICNGKIAMATVEYFCREISQHTMTGDTDKESIRNYGFSVCAGISYMRSHFPFYVGYEVAEACCDSAKSCAKLDGHKEIIDADSGKERIGNWVDFQFCKNIQAQNLEQMRSREYVTNHNEHLICRPYFISTEADGKLKPLRFGLHALDTLKRNILYLQDDDRMPRSFSKNLRNLYSQGRSRVDQFCEFLKSRNWKLPDGEDDPYEEENRTCYAKWYDALELMDDYIDLDEVNE